MNGNSAKATNPPSIVPFRIFLASPGDVAYERQLAREVVEKVGSERLFRGRLSIEIVAWDQPGGGVPMEAGLNPQEAIALGLPRPEDCDLVIVILWSRIGTPLPKNLLKEDGSRYLSGTEWEYHNAVTAFRARGKPSVWLYRRDEEPRVGLNDPQRDEKLAQWESLQGFLGSLAHADGSLAGGINGYTAPDGFRQAFEQHLRDRLTRLVQESAPAAGQEGNAASPPAAPRWTDVPYPGLDVFTPEQAPIFFGRGSEVDQLIRLLGDSSTRLLAIVGVSGSGKSSLVAAGLVPRLRAGVVGGAPWRDLRLKPGERGADPFLALAYALKPTQGTTGETERALATALRAEPDRFEQAVSRLLGDQPAGCELLVVVDQFEELFTLSEAGARQAFVGWLEHALALPRVRLVATLRADFYARAVEEPVLARLLRSDRGTTFPLDLPGPVALQEMIAGPAQAAGLELEEGLVEQVLKEAGSNPGALALVAFAMHELYEKGHADGRLTLSEYRDIGGVSGAVRRRAEDALTPYRIKGGDSGAGGQTEEALPPLQPAAQQALDGLFDHLVEVNEQELTARRRALKAQLKQGSHKLADALTEARLLVTGKGAEDVPTVEIAHEALLSAWPRLVEWIRQHAEALRARRDLESVATEWQNARRPRSGLRTGPLLQRYRSAAGPRTETADVYLAACRRRVWWQRAGFAAMGLAGLLGLGLFWHLSQSQYGPALAAKGLVVELGLWPVAEPPMQPIDPGEFEMGDSLGNGDKDERPVHPVRFAKSFEIGVYEVTFAEYDLFAAATGREKPNDQGWGRDTRPVINVSWEDATAYAQWLSEHAGHTYRLPTEAEWEYAARAKTPTSRYWPETADEKADPACAYANVFDQRNADRIRATYAGITWEPFACEDPFPFTAPVGRLEPNPWGLYDTLGNVWEWVADCWHGDYQGAPDDGTAWQEANGGDCDRRVVRGGSWGNEPELVRSALRDRLTADTRYFSIGFRLARSL